MCCCRQSCSAPRSQPMRDHAMGIRHGHVLRWATSQAESVENDHALVERIQNSAPRVWSVPGSHASSIHACASGRRKHRATQATGLQHCVCAARSMRGRLRRPCVEGARTMSSMSPSSAFGCDMSSWIDESIVETLRDGFHAPCTRTCSAALSAEPCGSQSTCCA
eukprot:6184836-Pleurochrysis_carterae.AAC.1